MINLNKICDIGKSKQCYVKENLASRAHSPNQLAVNVVTNTLYFSFDSGQGEYIPATLNIDTKRLTVLKGVKDAFAIASDPVNHEIYFGGNHGIYRYNPTLNSLKRLSVNNLDIWWLQVKSRIYFIKFPSLKMYYYKNRSLRPIPELRNSTVNQFVLDSEDNIFFFNSTGLFGLKKGSDEVIFLRDNPRFLGIASDNAGHVHLCSEDGIYVINEILMRVKRIVNVQGVLGITFDKDNNLIYSDSHEIVRLKPTSKDDYYDADKSVN
ncbi:unnamed protein product, partial [Brenthis ino]